MRIILKPGQVRKKDIVSYMKCKINVFISMFFAFALSLHIQAQELAEHVQETIECENGFVAIDAVVAGVPSEIYTGEVSPINFTLEEACSLYGKSEEWVIEQEIENTCRYEEGSCLFYAGIEENGAGISFEVKEGSRIGAEETDKRSTPEHIAKMLGIQTRNYANTENSTYKSYLMMGCILDVPVAFYSPVPCFGMVSYANGALENFNFHGRYDVTDKTAAQILPMDEMIEYVRMYAESGIISPPENYSQRKIYEIEFQYYLEETKEGLCFKPIWCFKVEQDPARAETGLSNNAASWNYLYIDAMDGLLLDYWGY